MEEQTRERLKGVQRRAWLAAGGGAALLALGAWLSFGDFLESYLFAYVYWTGLSLGCFGLLLLHHLVSGRWGHVIQRFLEAGTRVLPVMAILFLPIAFGMDHLYSWTGHGEGEVHGHVVAKAAYLNAPFFLIRAGIYFAFWILLAFLLSRWSRLQDRNGDTGETRRMKIASAPGMIAFVLVGTFASVDWLMSLEPEWFSSIYGLMILTAQGHAALSFGIVMLWFLKSSKPFSDILTTTHYHHLGNLLLALTVFWTYLAFSQYLIIWSGNLPEENFWYINRQTAGWSIVAVVILVGHFFVPFLLLLVRRMKKSIDSLALIAAGLLVMRLVDYFWLVKPAFSPDAFSFSWTDAVAPLALGGIWIAAIVGQLQGAPLMAKNDPRFEHGQLRGREHGGHG